MNEYSAGQVFVAFFSGIVLAVAMCVFVVLSTEKEREDACAKEHNVYQCEGQRIYVPVQEVE